MRSRPLCLIEPESTVPEVIKYNRTAQCDQAATQDNQRTWNHERDQWDTQAWTKPDTQPGREGNRCNHQTRQCRHREDKKVWGRPECIKAVGEMPDAIPQFPQGSRTKEQDKGEPEESIGPDHTYQFFGLQAFRT